MYSGCAFFGAFKEISDYCRFTIAERSLLFPLVAHQVFLQHFSANNGAVSIEQSIARYLEQQRLKLLRIVEKCKPFAERDAMINALNTLYSFNTLASLSLKDFMNDLEERYGDGPALDS